MSDLYKRIEKFGKEQGYKNMTVLCKAAGVPRSAMSELNSGRSKDISKPNAEKFAILLGKSLDEIYGREKEKPVTESDELEKYIDMLRTRPEMRLLLDTQDGATKEQVEENVRFLDALRKAKNAD